MHTTRTWIVTLAAAALLAACGGDDENNGDNNGTENNTTNNETANSTTNNASNNGTTNNATNNGTTTTNNGTTTAAVARLQVIHNAADPGAASVDVYANGALLLDDFEFRTASPFVDVPADADIDVAVAASDSESADDAIATFGPYNLPEDSTTILVANGVLAPDDFEANPDGNDIAFGLWVVEGREAAEDDTKFEFAVVHGATDAPTVDVDVAGAGLKLVDDAAYGDVAPYQAVDPAAYVLDLKTGDESTTVASYDLDASGFAGVSAVVLASGFLSTGGDDPDENAFELVYYTADGGAAAVIPTAD